MQELWRDCSAANHLYCHFEQNGLGSFALKNHQFVYKMDILNHGFFESANEFRQYI